MKRLCSLGLGLFALCALMAAGCLEEFPEWPDRSGGARSAVVPAELQALFDRCTGCHNEGNSPLDLSDPARSYENLVGVASVSACPGELLVAPGRSSDSCLIKTLRAEVALVMPPAGNRLTAGEVSQISAWIDELPTGECEGEVEGGGGDDMVCIEGRGIFCIDKFEASLECDPPRAISVQGVLPASAIDLAAAQAACTEAGKRLCTPDEWLSACQSSDANTWPYGNEFDAEACYSEAHPSWRGNDDGAARTGAYPGCVSIGSSSKLFDMGGNLTEWTFDPDRPDHANQDLKGGSYVGAASRETDGDQLRCLQSLNVERNLAEKQVGFRCCTDAP